MFSLSLHDLILSVLSRFELPRNNHDTSQYSSIALSLCCFTASSQGNPISLCKRTLHQQAFYFLRESMRAGASCLVARQQTQNAAGILCLRVQLSSFTML